VVRQRFDQLPAAADVGADGCAQGAALARVLAVLESVAAAERCAPFAAVDARRT